MEEPQEYNIQKYELNQSGKDYILTTGLINDNLRITCRDHIELTGPIYISDFSLSDLSSKNKYFILSDSIESAQNEINKAIERQKCGLKEEGNVLKIIIYLTIGTDRSNLNLSLLKHEGPYNQIKQEEPQFIGKSNLDNKFNYPKDEQRINKLDSTTKKIKESQDLLQNQFEQLIEQSMKLINETYFLKEDNAKLKERIKIIRNDNNLRKNNLINLRNENKLLKDENAKLIKDNQILEQKLKNKNESNIKNLEENNRKSQQIQKNDSSSGPVARTTKFEKSNIQTFVSRPTERPSGQLYQQNYENENVDQSVPFKKSFSGKHS